MEKIKITAGDIVILAILNDKPAAKDFETRIPFMVIGNDSGIDYCCVAQEGKSDPRERQTVWKNGDINLAGEWFALLYGDEEHPAYYEIIMIIGHIDAENLKAVKRLPSKIELTLKLD